MIYNLIIPPELTAFMFTDFDFDRRFIFTCLSVLLYLFLFVSLYRIAILYSVLRIFFVTLLLNFIAELIVTYFVQCTVYVYIFILPELKFSFSVVNYFRFIVFKGLMYLDFHLYFSLINFGRLKATFFLSIDLFISRRFSPELNASICMVISTVVRFLKPLFFMYLFCHLYITWGDIYRFYYE